MCCVCLFCYCLCGRFVVLLYSTKPNTPFCFYCAVLKMRPPQLCLSYNKTETVPSVLLFNKDSYALLCYCTIKANIPVVVFNVLSYLAVFFYRLLCVCLCVCVCVCFDGCMSVVIHMCCLVCVVVLWSVWWCVCGCLYMLG